MNQQKNNIDVLEASIPQDILEVLLRDHSYREEERHIFWATYDYESLGEGYQFTDEIKSDKIINNSIIVPRVLKARGQQTAR